jgi:hypothetical protein
MYASRSRIKYAYVYIWSSPVWMFPIRKGYATSFFNAVVRRYHHKNRTVTSNFAVLVQEIDNTEQIIYKG